MTSLYDAALGTTLNGVSYSVDDVVMIKMS